MDTIASSDAGESLHFLITELLGIVGNGADYLIAVLVSRYLGWGYQIWNIIVGFKISWRTIVWDWNGTGNRHQQIGQTKLLYINRMQISLHGSDIYANRNMEWVQMEIWILL